MISTKENILKIVVNSPPFTCIGYSGSEWGAVFPTFFYLCVMLKKEIHVSTYLGWHEGEYERIIIDI